MSTRKNQTVCKKCKLLRPQMQAVSALRLVLMIRHFAQRIVRSQQMSSDQAKKKKLTLFKEIRVFCIPVWLLCISSPHPPTLPNSDSFRKKLLAVCPWLSCVLSLNTAVRLENSGGPSLRSSLHPNGKGLRQMVGDVKDAHARIPLESQALNPGARRQEEMLMVSSRQQLKKCFSGS